MKTKKMKKIFLLLVTICFLTKTIGQINNKEVLIRRLINIENNTKSFEAIIDNMIEIRKATFDYLGDEFFEKLKMKFKEQGLNDLFESLISVYDKHFSEEQLLKIVEFYESETGKYLLSKQPEMISESMQIGAQWGEKIGLEISEEIKESKKYKFNIELTGCEEFKTGEFYSYAPDSSVIKIKRTDDLQVEIYQGEEYKYSIEWITPCKYVIKKIEGKKSDINDISVNIYEVTEKGYKYMAKPLAQELYKEGEILKIK